MKTQSNNITKENIKEIYDVVEYLANCMHDMDYQISQIHPGYIRSVATINHILKVIYNLKKEIK